MSRITAVVNQKGGVGKTTTTVNLAHAFAKNGTRRVLAVDLDPQASLSAVLGMDIGQIEKTIYDLFLEVPLGQSTAQVIHTTSTEGVSLLPSTIDLASAEELLLTRLSRERVLSLILKPVAFAYDEILIDCPPNLGQLTINALTAADEIIVPFEPDYLGLRALGHLMRTVDNIKAMTNPNLHMSQLVITKFDKRTRHARIIVDEVRRTFPGKVIEAEVPYSVKAKDAVASGKSIFAYDPDSSVAVAYQGVAEELENHAEPA